MRRLFWFRLTAMLLCLLLTGCTTLCEEALIASPDYPDMAPYPSSDDPWGDFDVAAYAAWRESILAQRRDSAYADGLAHFLTRSTQTILSGGGDENRVYSPLSLYMALAMLVEASGGQTRAELLALLGQEDVSSLRQQASDLWSANYLDDDATTRTLATSLWLSESVPFRAETLQILADSYYTSAYRGRMGSAELDAALQRWLNDNTMGLLSEQVQSVHLPGSTAVALASTVAFKARWSNTFDAENNVTDVFHAPSGDLPCTFMRSSDRSTLYWGERWQAVYLPYAQDGGMWLILPDEDVSPEELLTDADCIAIVTGGINPDVQRAEMRINLSLPKFDVSSQLKLSDNLRALGITEAFDAASADFTPLTDADIPISISQVRHDARVVVDEEGSEAAAYTVIVLAGAAAPKQVEEIDFVLDRPFLFVISGADDLPLFVGIVNQP